MARQPCGMPESFSLQICLCAQHFQVLGPECLDLVGTLGFFFVADFVLSKG
jgi:hypothetical protein